MKKTLNCYWKIQKSLYQRAEKARGFPGGSAVVALLATAGDTGSIPDLGRSHLSGSNEACGPQLLICALEPRDTTTEPMWCNY